MKDTSLDRYIEIKQQISELEKELDELKDQVFSDVEAKGGLIDNDRFVIRSYKNPRYKFSADYEIRASDLKELRKKEIEEGTAVVEGFSEFVKLNIKNPKKPK